MLAGTVHVGKMRFVFKSGLWSRVGYNDTQTVSFWPLKKCKEKKEIDHDSKYYDTNLRNNEFGCFLKLHNLPHFDVARH